MLKPLVVTLPGEPLATNSTLNATEAVNATAALQEAVSQGGARRLQANATVNVTEAVTAQLTAELG